MAQPSIPGTAVGIPRMAYGNDGTNWIAVLVDALGHIQADILSTVLPTDAATQTTLAACLTALQLIDDLRAALGSVNTDDLQVDVKTSALPTDAAKETKQDTMITALQLIDDLRNALGSVNTDDLQVDIKTYPGSNALGNFPFGYYDRYSEALTATSTGEASTFARSTAVPTGEVWVIEAVSAFHDDPTARLTAINMYDATNRVVLARTLSLAQYVQILWAGRITLKAGDKVEVQVDSLTTGKAIAAVAWGHKMKVA